MEREYREKMLKEIKSSGSNYEVWNRQKRLIWATRVYKLKKY